MYISLYELVAIEMSELMHNNQTIFHSAALIRKENFCHYILRKIIDSYFKVSELCVVLYIPV